MKELTKPYIVGIAGGSASGKTTLLRKLVEHFPADVLTLISQDNYYISSSDLPRDLSGEINFDHPEAMDLDAMARDLLSISQGNSVEVEEYTYNNPELPVRMITYRPAPIVVVEGLFVFNHSGAAGLLDLKIFVDTAEHLRLSRRIRRDAEERGYGLEDVLDYYERFVAPMYRRHIEPFKEDCDLVIPNNHHMENAITVLINHLDVIASGRR
jgi:uridine kinase